MTIDAESSHPDPGGEQEPVRTGVPRVDEVIRAVEALEERPVEEHAGVFEAAQTRLREALDDPGTDDESSEAADSSDQAG